MTSWLKIIIICSLLKIRYTKLVLPTASATSSWIEIQVVKDPRPRKFPLLPKKRIYLIKRLLRIKLM